MLNQMLRTIQIDISTMKIIIVLSDDVNALTKVSFGLYEFRMFRKYQDYKIKHINFLK
jgi:hypothetical protein